MSLTLKKFIALLLVLLFSLAIFLYTEFFSSKPQILTNNQPQISLMPSANLSFSPNLLTTSATSSAQVNILLETNTPASLIQLEIGYDPKALFNVQIAPGDYFITPQIMLYNIDIKNGRISYALKGETSNLQSKNVAVITFNSYNYGSPKETTLSFLPKTLVKNSNGSIKTSATTEAKIIIGDF